MDEGLIIEIIDLARKIKSDAISEDKIKLGAVLDNNKMLYRNNEEEQTK